MPLIEQTDRPAAITHLMARVQTLEEHAIEHLVYSSGILNYIKAVDGGMPENLARANLDPHSQTKLALADQERDSLVMRIAESQTVLDTVETLYNQADQTDFAQKSNYHRAATRLNMFNEVGVTSDVDGTLTDPEVHTKFEGGIDGALLGSGLADPLHGEGRKHFNAAWATIWSDLVEAHPALYEEAGNNVRLRKGMDRFFQYAQKEGIRLSIDTTNFGRFPHSVARRLSNHPEEIEINCVTSTSVIAAEKNLILLRQIIEDPNVARVFVGDGATDEKAISAHRQVAFYFALEGSSFAKALKEAGVLYFTYKTGDDIIKQLDYIRGLQAFAPKFSRRLNQLILN